MIATNGWDRTYNVTVTDMTSSIRKNFILYSHRNFIFMSFNIKNVPTSEFLQNIEMNEIISVAVHKFPILRLVSPRSFDLFQFGASNFTYNYYVVPISHNPSALRSRISVTRAARSA